MKAGKEHRIPLSDRCLAILKEMKAKRLNDYVFPRLRAKTPISEYMMPNILSENGGEGFTVHGTARSTFRDWVTEATRFDSNMAEMALSHAVGNAVTRAYARSDALEKRRELMEAWAAYCEPRAAGNAI